MPAPRIAAWLALASSLAYGQALLDDATIGKLVKAGVAERTIVAMINQQPGNYTLSSEDTLALKKAGVSDNILAAMVARNGAGTVRRPRPLRRRPRTRTKPSYPRRCLCAMALRSGCA